MLIISMLFPVRQNKLGKEVLGKGPRCDVCGEYLSEHKFHDCEKYC